MVVARSVEPSLATHYTVHYTLHYSKQMKERERKDGTFELVEFGGSFFLLFCYKKT